MATITVYRFTGKHGPFTIPGRMCEECDLSISMVKRIAGDVGMKNVKIEVKSWFTNFLEVIIKGGWHAPVITVNGKICSQGKVPDYYTLKSKVAKLL